MCRKSVTLDGILPEKKLLLIFKTWSCERLAMDAEMVDDILLTEKSIV